MFPIFTEINAEVYANINSSGKGLAPNTNVSLNSSELVPFVRLISGTGKGLIMQSNNINVPITSNTAVPTFDKNKKVSSVLSSPSLYGNRYVSGMLGYNWKLEPVFPFNTPFTGDLVLRPSPIITDIEVKEGKDQISRHAKVVIKCFSLAQAEMVQEHCMEPGHSLLIEYGWNTDNAKKHLIDIADPRNPQQPVSSDEISFQAANENINQSLLEYKRSDSKGDYDSFFGFIVGGDMTSEGDIYVLTIKLRGMPGLPTYLQLHQNINKINEEKDANGKVIKRVVSGLPEVPPYSQSELEKPDGTLENQGARRWKWLFNKLPATRQTTEVQALIDSISNSTTSNVGWWDLINFDWTVSNDIATYAHDDFFDNVKLKLGIEKEFTAGGIPIEKERLVSNNRYIRFSKALEILNRNNGLNSYKMGGKTIKVRVQTSGYIGAFPGIFSTRATKLVIPGVIPDFQKYYLNTSTVTINDIINSPYIDNSINISYQQTVGPVVTRTNVNNTPWAGGFMNTLWQQAANVSKTTSIVTEKISFVQYSSDGKGLMPAYIDPNNPSKGTYLGYHENDGYYGELGNLYISYTVFIEALKNASNKSMREVLLEMLNEMSSAVNSFWNFQLVEQTNSLGDITIQIIDENWAGKNKSTQRWFNHSGEKSVFLEANLSIDIPSEMTNQIILKRVDYTSNPDSKGLQMGGIFSKETDMFFKGVDYLRTKNIQQSGASGNTGNGNNTQTLNQKVATLKAQRDAIKKTLVPASSKLNWFQKFARTVGTSQTDVQTETYIDAKTGEEVFTEITYGLIGSGVNKAVSAVSGQKEVNITYADTPLGKKFQKLDEELEQAQNDADSQSKTTVTNNLTKIDVVPNPEKLSIDANALDVEKNGEALFRNMFRIYCCDDTQLFDVIKNNAFEKYNLEEKGATSHPLPIKYTFKILGKSGLKRGDIFNIVGIPRKYRDYGFFQIVDIEQTLSESTWTTTVTGQFRQQTQ